MPVPNLVTWLLAAVGLLLFAVVSLRVLLALMRFTRTAGRARHGFGEAAGLLRARSAALKIAVTQRFGGSPDRESRRVRSTEYGQTGGRP
jgi:hypothetical protein